MADGPFRAALSFLTVLPVGGGGGAEARPADADADADAAGGDAAGPRALGPAARGMPAFPIVGMIVGLAAGSAGAGALLAGADPMVAAFVAVAATAVLTGFHHLDGLADAADGLMARGTRARRIAAMRDGSVGAAGTSAVALSCIGAVAGLSLAGGAYGLVLAVVLSEAAAKFAMVLMAAAGRPAAAGSSAVFAAAAHGRAGRLRLAAAAAAAAVPAVVLGGHAGALALAAAAAAALVLVLVSSRSLGGITGDVLGAGNEVARLAAVLVFVSA